MYPSNTLLKREFHPSKEETLKSEMYPSNTLLKRMNFTHQYFSTGMEWDHPGQGQRSSTLIWHWNVKLLLNSKVNSCTLHLLCLVYRYIYVLRCWRVLPSRSMSDECVKAARNRAVESLNAVNGEPHPSTAESVSLAVSPSGSAPSGS